MASDIQLDLLTAETLPTKAPDGTPVAQKLARGDGYGDLVVAPLNATQHLLAMEGSYLLATTPVPGTGVAYGSGGTQATFSDTAGFLVVQNASSIASGKKFYPHVLRILVSGTVPAAATSTQFAIRIDSASRVPSANFTLLTAASGVAASPMGLSTTNLQSANPALLVWVPSAGTLTIPLSGGSARPAGRGSLRQTISVTLDEYVIMFGGPDGPGTSNGAGAGRFVSHNVPICLNPQEFMVVHLWQPSATTNPLTCEIELGGWLR